MHVLGCHKPSVKTRLCSNEIPCWMAACPPSWRPRDAQTNATKDGEEEPKAMAIPSDQTWFATKSNFQCVFSQLETSI